MRYSVWARPKRGVAFCQRGRRTSPRFNSYLDRANMGEEVKEKIGYNKKTRAKSL